MCDTCVIAKLTYPQGRQRFPSLSTTWSVHGCQLDETCNYSLQPKLLFSDKPRGLEDVTSIQSVQENRQHGGQGPTWLAALKEHRMKSEDPPGWPASRCIGPKRVLREVSKEGRNVANRKDQLRLSCKNQSCAEYKLSRASCPVIYPGTMAE